MKNSILFPFTGKPKTSSCIKSFIKMLLRSSSTPAIGTLLSSVSDSPNSAHHHHFNLTSFSCNSSSPNSHSASGFIEFNPGSKSLGLKAIRRAWSDGNLEGLVDSSCDMEEFRNSVAPRTSSSYQDNNSMLETAPSFSIFHSGILDFQGSDQEPLERTITIGENIESMMGGGDFCFGKKSMGLIEEKGEEEEEGLDGIQSLRVEEQVRPASPPMYLAAGLGVHAAGFGWDAWDDELSMANIDESGNGEEYYKRMVDEYPCHPLFLRNYAQALQVRFFVEACVFFASIFFFPPFWLCSIYNDYHIKLKELYIVKKLMQISNFRFLILEYKVLMFCVQ